MQDNIYLMRFEFEEYELKPLVEKAKHALRSAAILLDNDDYENQKLIN